MLFRPTGLLLGCLLTAAVVAQGSVPAQTPLDVGFRSVAWPNPTSLGSPTLLATVRYPAVTAGADTPILNQAGGWPVVVFLHGFGWFGYEYSTIADAWASAGFVVVLPDTCQWDWVCQERDGRAIHGAIQNANVDAMSPFAGAFDPQRIALAGHSMGGSSVGNILADNPGYRCGMTLAPVMALGNNSALVTVPFGIVVGVGDMLTPWPVYAQPYYDAVVNHGSLKFQYVLDATCDHMNIAGLTQDPTPVQAAAVFDRGVKISLGFLRHCLEIDPTGLESTIGPDALAEPMLVSLQREVVIPQMWLEPVLRLGVTTRVSVAVEGLFAALFAAGARIPGVPTPFGMFELDPVSAFAYSLGLSNAEKRVDLAISLPSDPTLIGLPVALQSLADDATQQWVLSNSLMLFVQP